MKINKSQGTTHTESYLSELCDKTFLKLWSYANPHKRDGKEICDLLAVFGNHVFLFFDRESRILDCSKSELPLQWKRWKKKVITDQIKTSLGAAKYIARYPDEIYLDSKQSVRLPIQLPTQGIHIHKIIVAHGASEACKRFSDENINGSLAITYSDEPNLSFQAPFIVNLDKADPVHIFDSHNLGIILSDLDTFCDFKDYLLAKEEAIQKYSLISYCGEEDLLAHYYSNYDKKSNRHYIGPIESDLNAIFVDEGHWQDFVNSEPYKRRKAANNISYDWDKLIQQASLYALNDELVGNIHVFNTRNPLFEMASESRVIRRYISERIRHAIKNFPDNNESSRGMSFIGLPDSDKCYIFLQVSPPSHLDYEGEYRPKRQEMLKIACGAAKIKFPHFKTIVGIAIDPPKLSSNRSKDFLLLDCEKWTIEDRDEIEKCNENFRFFKSENNRMQFDTSYNFPPPNEMSSNDVRKKKIGRNEKCPCDSGRKYKRCCGR